MIQAYHMSHIFCLVLYFADLISTKSANSLNSEYGIFTWNLKSAGYPKTVLFNFMNAQYKKSEKKIMKNGPHRIKSTVEYI